MNQTKKRTYNCNLLILSGRFCEVVQINLLSEFRLFLQHYYFWNDSLEIVLLTFKLFLSPARLCL